MFDSPRAVYQQANPSSKSLQSCTVHTVKLRSFWTLNLVALTLESYLPIGHSKNDSIDYYVLYILYWTEKQELNGYCNAVISLVCKACHPTWCQAPRTFDTILFWLRTSGCSTHPRDSWSPEPSESTTPSQECPLGRVAAQAEGTSFGQFCWISGAFHWKSGKLGKPLTWPSW